MATRKDGTDRRAQRTRRLLAQALVALIRVKRYEAITVQEIAEYADVGRSTFYAHYTDKDELLVDSVHQMLEGLETGPPGSADTLAFSLALFHHVASHSHKDLYEVMARGRHLALFLDALQSELTAVLTARLNARAPRARRTAVPVPLLAAMVGGMLITTVRTWLDAGLTPSAAVVNRAFVTAAEAAIAAGLRPVGP